MIFKYKLIFYFFLLVYLASCREQAKFTDVEIKNVIQNIDLRNKIYTVFFMSKEPVRAKFSINPEEKKILDSMFSKIDFSNLKHKIIIEDSCRIMPKIITQLSIEVRKKRIIIDINEECDSYLHSQSSFGLKIREFIQAVRKIVSTKPEVKKLPNSDIFFL